MLKILHARLQWDMNCELPDVQVGLRKGRGTRDQTANIRWTIIKAREFQNNIYFCFIDYTKTIDCADHNKLWKILKRDGDTRSPDLSLETSVNWTWNNRLVPNRKRSMSRLYIVTLLIQLICRVHHEKGWTERSTSWNQDSQEKYQ